MHKAGGLTKFACGALVLLLMLTGPFLLVPALSTRASTLTSATYTGKLNVAWTGIVADYDGLLNLGTNLSFSVTIDQPVGGGELDGTANGTGTLTGSWSVNDPVYPAGCPTQVSITGHYTFEVYADLNSSANQLNFSAYGPNDYVEVDNPPPGPNCWPGVSEGGVPETYAQWTIEKFMGDCFNYGGACWSFPTNGGTTTACTSTMMVKCTGTFQVSLVSSTTSTSTTQSTTRTTSSSSSTRTSTSSSSTSTSTSSSSSSASSSSATTTSTSSISTTSSSSTATSQTSSSATTTTTNSTSCPDMYLTEGLAPAASTTGNDNVYVTVYWGGQTPVSVDFGAFPSNPTMNVGFTFNPVTMYSSTVTVLMSIGTQGTTIGNYNINVAAQLVDPVSGQTCSNNMKVYVTVSATTVFVGTLGTGQSEAIWVQGLSSPFMVSGAIAASQYSNFVPTLGSNGKMANLTFAITGPEGAQMGGTLTIPKTLVNPGFVPVLYIDGTKTGITVTQDSTNYYINYVATFSTHTVVLSFVEPASTGTTTASGNTISITSASTTSSTTTSSITTGTTSSQQSSTTSSSSLSPSILAPVLVVVALLLAILSAGRSRARHSRLSPMPR